MTRQNATNFSGALQFPFANTAADLFKKEDVQVLAQAVDQHDHTTGKGKSVAPVAGSITNAMLGPDVARASLLTNGSFEIWQRGTGGFTTNATYACDGWMLTVGAGSAMNVGRVAGETAGSYAAQITYTHAALSALFQKFVLTSERAQLIGKQVSLSARVLCNTANTVRLGTAGGAPDGFSAYHPGGGTWQTLTCTATVGAGSEFHFRIECNASSTGFYVDSAMLVVGSQPSDYAPLHPADDLARCLRYYEIIGDGGQSISCQAYSTAGGSINFPLPYKARKAVTPTVTKVGTWGVANCAQPTIPSPGFDIFYIAGVATALGMAQFYNTTAPAITLESNP